MKKLIILLAVVFFAACGNTGTSETPVTEKDRIEELNKEVMKVHDKTMAQMSEMAKLRKDLQEASANAADTAVYYNSYNDLQQAHNDMMDWMHNFENLGEMEATDAEKVEYLETQKAKIEDISEYTDSSIQRAREVLEKGN